MRDAVPECHLCVFRYTTSPYSWELSSAMACLVENEEENILKTNHQIFMIQIFLKSFSFISGGSCMGTSLLTLWNGPIISQRKESEIGQNNLFLVSSDTDEFQH